MAESGDEGPGRRWMTGESRNVEKEETPSRSKGNGCIARSSHTHVQKHKFKR